jgi:hypothetical protein
MIMENICRILIILVILVILSSCCSNTISEMDTHTPVDERIGKYCTYEFVGYERPIPVNIPGLLIFKDEKGESCFVPTEYDLILYTMKDDVRLEMRYLYAEDSSERIMIDTTREFYDPDPVLVVIANHPDFERLQVGEKYKLRFYKHYTCHVRFLSTVRYPWIKIDPNVEYYGHYLIKNKKIVDQVYECDQIYSVFVEKAARIDE